MQVKNDKESKGPEEAKSSKRRQHLRVPVFPEEKAIISEKASAARLSMAAYLRRVGCGYSVESVVDLEAVNRLLKSSADLGRLGGLLKLWLTSDEHLHRIPAREVRAVLANVERLNEKMFAAIEELVG